MTPSDSPSIPPSTARQRVRTTLCQTVSPATPFTWGFGPSSASRHLLVSQMAERGLDWDRLRQASEDVAWLHPRYVGGRVRPGQPEYMAIWGIETRAIDEGAASYQDEIAHCPLAGVEDAAVFDRYAWPATAEYDYESLNAVWREKDAEGVRAVRLSLGNPFEIYSWMTGLEEAMVNLIANPDLVRAALRHINDFFLENLACQARAFRGQPDLIQMGDDLGGQQGPLLSREIYRAVIQPFHRELCESARRLFPNAVIEYHTDGSVFTLLPDLIEIGVQMLEAVQVECAHMQPRLLKSTFGKSLMYQGAISVQQLLPRATPEEVRRTCRELIEVLGTEGGYLPAPSHAIQVGTPPDNVLAMLEEVLGPERYATALESARRTPA